MDLIESLQWGRGQLTAEIAQIASNPCTACFCFNGAAVMLTAEIWYCRTCRRLRSLASMGPRSVDRGNRIGFRVVLRRGRCASMGPRSVDRGNVDVAKLRRSTSSCFNGAAVMLTAEIVATPVAVLNVPTLGFNGAAVMLTAEIQTA